MGDLLALVSGLLEDFLTFVPCILKLIANLVSM